MDTDDQQLASELIAMMDEQREFLARSGTGPDSRYPLPVRLQRRAMFVRHADCLRELLTGGKWPTAARVGDRAAQAAWLIAQHADTQLDVQRLSVKLLRAAVFNGEGNRKELAMLEDRIAVNEGRPQVYGTQIAEVIGGKPIPWPCVEPQRLDELRAQAGIEPFKINADRYSGNS